jgi:hypothetical protein
LIIPSDPHGNVTVRLAREGRFKHFKVVAMKRVRLSASSKFKVSFHRSKAKRCAATATFYGDEQHWNTGGITHFPC